MAFRLYLDEVGNDDLRRSENENRRYLSLTGIAMSRNHARDWLIPHLDEFKRRIFQHDPDTPVILHRRDIYQYKGPFGILKNDQDLRDTFDNALVWLINRAEYTVITAVIDKHEMQSQTHWQQRHPYHYLMEIIAEKYAQWLVRMDSSGDIMPESRQGKQNGSLQAAFDEVRSSGTKYVSAEALQYRLRGKKLKFRDKKENIAGLQICDLLAHPSHMHTRQCQGHNVTIAPFSARLVPILVNYKYDRSCYGVIRGYGMKYLP